MQLDDVMHVLLLTGSPCLLAGLVCMQQATSGPESIVPGQYHAKVDSRPHEQAGIGCLRHTPTMFSPADLTIFRQIAYVPLIAVVYYGWLSPNVLLYELQKVRPA